MVDTAKELKLVEGWPQCTGTTSDSFWCLNPGSWGGEAGMGLKKNVEGTKMIHVMSEPGVGVSHTDGYANMGLWNTLRIPSFKGVASPEHLFLYL